MRHGSLVRTPVLVLLAAMIAAPALAQVDVSGEWGAIFHEDLPHRGGMRQGDFTGLPLNEAGQRKAASWDEAMRSIPEWQWTEDWRWRMILPRKGDYSSVPLNETGREVADAWDPAAIASDGCKPFGAAAVMRVPGAADRVGQRQHAADRHRCRAADAPPALRRHADTGG